MSNIITVDLSRGRKVETSTVFQWNHGMTLRFIRATLPESFRVDFSNSTRGKAKSMIGSASNGVVIPDEYFMPGSTIYAWIVLFPTENSAVAEWQISIPIDPKAKATDEEPNPQQESVIDQAINALNTAVAEAQEAITHYPKVVDGYWYVWDVTAGEYVTTGVKSTGEDGFSPIVTVSSITGGHRVTITDADGDHVFDVMDGEPGQPGYSPTASVSKSGNTATITITDQQGTTTATVTDGENGQPGYSPTASVSKSGSTATITITDKQGTTTAQITDGSTGPGVPAGGTTGQMLVKKSDSDYDGEWQNQPSVPVQDVQVDGQSVVDGQGVADIPLDSKADVIISSASGAIASFADGADDMPLRECVVQIEPVQDLHGYENPWPAGGGVNKLPNAISKTETINGITYKLDEYGVFTVTGTSTSASECTFGLAESFVIPSGDPKPKMVFNNTSASNSIKFNFYNGTTQVESWAFSSVNRVSEYTAMQGKTCTAYQVAIGAANMTVNMTFAPMIVENSVTDYTFAPYSNICPISGWTGANVSRTGKNLLNNSDAEWKGGYYLDNTGDEAGSGNYWYTQTYFCVDSNKTLCLQLNKADTSLAGCTVCEYDANKRFIRRDAVISSTATSGVLSGTFTTSATARFIRISAPRNCTDIQLEYGSTATPYTPYQGTTIPIAFPSEAGTVYGGTLDVTTGLLTVTHKYYENAGTGNWGEVTTGGARYYIGGVSSDAKGDSPNGWCNIGILSSSFYDDAVVVASNGRINLCGSIHDAFADINELVTYLQSHPIQVAYELAEPITYQLTPQEIRTLLGVNNIWADTGAVSVDYCADTKTYVDDAVPAVPVQDVQVNGTSILNQGVANVPLANANTLGVVKSGTGVFVHATAGDLRLNPASVATVRQGTSGVYPLTPSLTDSVSFYGLAKAAGADMASSSNPVGTYTEAAKSAISQMLDAPETVIGTTPSITAKAGVRYICGECATLTIVAPASGCIDVTFESGSTATVLTATGVTWPDWFDATALEANRTYELNICNGKGAVMSWA